MKQLVQRLLQIQEAFGYLPDEEMGRLAKETDTPRYRLQEIAGFFPHFRQEWNKPPYVEVKVCRDMSCHVGGAVELLDDEKGLKRVAAKAIDPLVAEQASRDGRLPLVVEGVSCLGRCDRAPVICVSRSVGLGGHGDGSFHDLIYAGRTSGNTRVRLLEEFGKIVSDIAAGGEPAKADLDNDYIVNRDGWQIDPYPKDSVEGRSYEAVKKFVADSPAGVAPPSSDVARDRDGLANYIKTKHPRMIDLEEAGLLGMGGAGVPAYRKWLDVWQARPADGSNIKYVVINGDESEPATFKDREILLHLPHLVVEGVILGGLMTNATAGFIYIRHEYGEQIQACRAEIKRAEELGACGKNIFGSGRDFPVEVFVSPGGYICGEQSALLEAMEDKRSQPRNRPPELSTNGLWDKPTVVNNVETIAWTPGIMLKTGKWYAEAGCDGYKGRRLFSICGDLVKPGVYEVQVGVTLGRLIEMAGGVPGGGPPKAIALSGPSGGYFPAQVPLPKGWQNKLKEQLKEADRKSQERLSKLFSALLPNDATHLDLLSAPLDKGIIGILAEVLDAPLMLGAGMAVYAPGRNMFIEAQCGSEFFRNESCGKCVPCRIGSQKLVNIGLDLLKRRNGEGLPLAEIKAAQDDASSLSKLMFVTSICGLGQVAPNPLNTALRFFADDAANGPNG